MSLPSLGRPQLQPVSPLVKLGPAGNGQAGQTLLTLCLPVYQLGQLLSPPFSPCWTLVSGVGDRPCLPDGVLLYDKAGVVAAFP